MSASGAPRSLLGELTAVAKSYGTGGPVTRVLRDVDLSIARDEHIVMYGVSGSGKTTLLNLIGALDVPSSGSVTIDGERISELSERGRTRFRAVKVGFVFQFYNLLPTLTAFENVQAALEVLPLSPAVIRGRSAEYLEAVGLGDKLEKFPAQLSGGEQQRVALARALAKEPPLILADEPTGNLDEDTGLEVMDVMTSLRRRTGATVIVATHDPRLTTVADRVLRIEHGRVLDVHSGEGR